MNAAHLHLVVNHVPVFGSIFAALLIGWGLLRKKEDVLRLGLIVAVIVGLTTWGVQLTGEPAEHALAGVQGFQRRLAHAHEEAAELSTIVIGVAALLALVTLVLMRRRRGHALAVVTLLVMLAGFGLVTRTAMLGGEISHPEARAGWVQPPPPPRPAGRPGGEGGERD